MSTAVNRSARTGIYRLGRREDIEKMFSSEKRTCCETQYWWTLEYKCDTVLNRKASEKKSYCILIIEMRYSTARCGSLAPSHCENTTTMRKTYH